MKRMFAALVVLMCNQSVGAPLGLERWRGFDVRVETIAEPIHVNGVPVVIHRAVGSGVAAMAETIRKQWVQEAGATGVRADARSGWTVVSRLTEGNLEAIQWRGSGTETQLLWSSMELSPGMRSAPRTQLPLPRGCVSGRIVHGNVDMGVYLQRTARCAGSARATVSTISASAVSRGYAVRSLDGMLIAHRRGMEIVVVAEKGDDPQSSGGSSLVYLQVDRRDVP